ncbi:MAG: NAD-dependent DNA ligase LigA [Puniceicoccales bacterium]|jgi:DNA ligase (NAD+)|nr:NAD-dependent DNA ligase LigA [Puniceicoccales bacterium]
MHEALNPKIRRYFFSLKKKLEEHDRHYYRDAAPIISDFEYDCLKHEWKELRRQYPALQLESETIGDDRREGFATFPHLSPMLSLSNTYDRSEVDAFDQRIRRVLGGKEALRYVVEHKIDGVAVNLIYEEGHLIRALTRGNGREGDDVTKNVLTIQGLPVYLPDAPQRLELRGEVYIPLEVFEEINRQQEERGEEPFANPRNLAAGTLKTLDTSIVQQRKLQLWIHSLGLCEGLSIATMVDFYCFLKKWQLPYVEFFENAHSLEEIWKCIGIIDQRRHTLHFATDGAVLKINDRSLQRILGETQHSPRWAFAYKFAPERVETRLEKISLQVGRSGAITPIAELKSVWIAGTEVKRATLHNASEIERKDIREGDIVVLEKAGEVIPAITEVVLSRRSPTSIPFVFPRKCPQCNALLSRAMGEIAWKCPNDDCSAKVECRILHFASRSAMHIEGLGDNLVHQLCQKGYVKNIADLYELSHEQLMNCNGIGTKTAEKVMQNLEQSKSCSLWRFLHGLGIPGIGEKTSKDLASSFPDVRTLMAASLEALRIIPGVGEKTALEVHAYFQSASVVCMIDRLEALGIRCIRAST